MTKAKLLTRTKEDKAKSKVMGKVIDWMFKDVDWELKRKLDKLQEYENKVNPLGLWEIMNPTKPSKERVRKRAGISAVERRVAPAVVGSNPTLSTPNPKTSMEERFDKKFPELMNFRPMKGIKGATSRNMKPQVLAFINKELKANDKKWRDKCIKWKDIKTEEGFVKAMRVNLKVIKDGDIEEAFVNGYDQALDSLLEDK